LVAGVDQQIDQEALQHHFKGYSFIDGVVKIKQFKSKPELLSVSVNSKETAKQVLLESGKYLKKLANNSYERNKLLIRLYVKEV
jgi:hypothetical protein